ncbi:MAG: phosphatidylglycerol lysyltransferase domain-containing protein [Clostridiales bacterium]|jgi:hypothetical protein|nr:phosphatidylglycerol lysyltransferase domain-containing protein [Clostridiales bacterium]
MGTTVKCDKLLKFKGVQKDDIKVIREKLKEQRYRICDYTTGAIYMWTEYYNYEYCIHKDTLFLKSDDTEDKGGVSFAVPIGGLSLDEAMSTLLENAEAMALKTLRINGAPRFAAEYIGNKYGVEIIRMENDGDYLYSAEELATLKGHKYNKKRNRVNLFLKTYENYSFEPITRDNIGEVKKFFEKFKSNQKESNIFADYENNHTQILLDNFWDFELLSGVLYVDGKVGGFTAGEIIDDTLYVHIEKADKDLEGVYQMINYLFSGEIYRKYGVAYINREEDLGDEGLRQAKLSYQPVEILDKYRIIIDVDGML